MPFIRDVSANYHSDKPSECYARHYTCMVHVGTYIALRPHRGFRLWTRNTAIYWSYTVSIYKTLKVFLSDTNGPIFYITWQECFFGHPLPRLFKPSWFVKKYGCKGAGLVFPIYLYRKLEKNLLVRNHWIHFSITLQKCFLGDPLPRLFKPSWFVKNHGC